MTRYMFQHYRWPVHFQAGRTRCSGQYLTDVFSVMLMLTTNALFSLECKISSSTTSFDACWVLEICLQINSVLLHTPPESNSSKRKRKATSEGKQTPKGSNLMCLWTSFVSCVVFINHACTSLLLLHKFSLAGWTFQGLMIHHWVFSH